MIIGEEWKDQVSKVTETSIPGQWKKEVKMANKDLDLDLSGAECQKSLCQQQQKKSLSLGKILMGIKEGTFGDIMIISKSVEDPSKENCTCH